MNSITDNFPRYYSLQIVQHPLRARMCGFGDKDRRPLAPAAVAKMVVRRDDNGLVEVELVFILSHLLRFLIAMQ